MAAVSETRLRLLARALLDAKPPQELPMHGRMDERHSGRERRVTPPAVAALVQGTGWKWNTAKILAGDPKYAVWSAAAEAIEREQLVVVAGGVDEEKSNMEAALEMAMERVRKAVARAGRRRERAEAAREAIEENPGRALIGAAVNLVRLREETRWEKVDYMTEREEERRERVVRERQVVERVEEIVRLATAVLDSRVYTSDEQHRQQEENTKNTLATEWFTTVHGAILRRVEEDAWTVEEMETGTMVEKVVVKEVRGVARQEEDHMHEVLTFEYPVTGEAVRQWTMQRYGVREARDVSAQPVRNERAALEYLRRQSLRTEAITWTRGGRGDRREREVRVLTSRREAEREAGGRGVRTHPSIPRHRTEEERQQEETQTYVYTRPYERRTAAGDPNYAPYTLIARGEAVPARGYTLHAAGREAETRAPLFFAAVGDEAVAVEADRDVALAANAGMLPRMATLYTTQEGAAVEAEERGAGEAGETMRGIAATAAALLRGVYPPQIQWRTRPVTTEGVRARAEADAMSRAARVEARRRQWLTRVVTNTERAPVYLRTMEAEGRMGVRDRVVRDGERRGYTMELVRGMRDGVRVVYDPAGEAEREAIETFAAPGIFYMTDSTALRYEGQPVVVYDSVQAERHRRRAQEIEAPIHIFRGTEEQERRILEREEGRAHSTIAIAEYPV